MNGIGTVVGAGFASGQEVLQFFGYFGLPGVIGLAATTVLLAVFGYMILELGRRLKADSHLPVIRYAGGKWVGSVVDWVITFFLFGGLVTIGAGAAAFGLAQFGFSNLVVTLFPAVGFAGLLLLGALVYGFVKDKVAVPAVRVPRGVFGGQPSPSLAFEVSEELADNEQVGRKAPGKEKFSEEKPAEEEFVK